MKNARFPNFFQLEISKKKRGKSVKTTAIWQEAHILEYIANNIEKYSDKYKEAQEKKPPLPFGKRNLKDAPGKAQKPSLLIAEIRRRDAYSNHIGCKLITDALAEHAKEKGIEIVADSENAIREAAKEACRMAKRYLSCKEKDKRKLKDKLIRMHRPPAPPLTEKFLNAEDLISYIRPRLDEYDKLTQELFSMSRKKNHETFRHMLDDINEKSGNKLSLPSDSNQGELILLLEKISILKMLSGDGSKYIKLSPENFDELDKANRQLNAESFNRYASSISQNEKEKLKRVIDKAVEQNRKNKERRKMS